MKKKYFILCILFLAPIFFYSKFKYQYVMLPIYWDKYNEKNQQKIYAGEKEPPIPELKELSLNIEGIDRNKNGIRDDIDIWINRVAANKNEILALRQTARALQNYLKGSIDKRYSEADALMTDIVFSENCMRFLALVYYKGQNHRRELDEMLDFLFFYPDGVKENYHELSPHLLTPGSPTLNGTRNDFKVCKFEIDDKNFVFGDYENFYKR